jgi:threonine dehydrogenase-like Zn-dependent dehydrogenase
MSRDSLARLDFTSRNEFMASRIRLLRMRGMWCNGNKIALRRELAPPLRPPGEARVRVRLAGICDTDLQLARGYMGYEGVIGHEFVGEVVECDEGAWMGKRVVADINAGCGACDDCRLRNGHHCPKRTVLGIVGRGGAMADELVVPERCLVEVPEQVPDECAVFAEPLAAALATWSSMNMPRPFHFDRDRVAVLGDGKLGLLTVMGLAAGWVRPTLVGHHPAKMKLVEAMCEETLLEDAIDARRPDPFEAVIEATGTAAGFARALSLVAPRGVLVLKTTIAGTTSADLSSIVIHEISVLGSRCGSMKDAVGTLLIGGVDPRPLIAARYSLDDAERAFAEAGSRGTLKVLVDPRMT